MDFEGLAELLVPLVFLGIVGGLIALRMLKPYGNRILELVREIQAERQQALAETRELQTIRDRLDMLAERQDFLESLLRHRLDEEEREELEGQRPGELEGGPGSSAGGPGGAAASGGPGDPSGPDG